MTVDLSCEFLGVKLRNPFLIASVPAASSWGFSKAAKAGWAGGIHWGGEATGVTGAWCRGYIPRDIEYVGKPPQWWAYQNTPVGDELDPKRFLPLAKLEKLIRKSKESGIAVICNILEGQNPEAWGEVAATAERGGADFLELNWSCPAMPGAGREIARNPELRKATLKAVRNNSKLPIMIKVSAHLEQELLHDLVKGAVADGANAVSITNTIMAMVGVDIETGLPLTTELTKEGKLQGMMTGISGPAIRPIGLRGVAEVRRATDVPISAIGGITKWEDVVEYMLLGASTVQVGTAVMLYGYRMVKDLIRGLEGWMERKGFKRTSDFIGITTDKYLPLKAAKQARKQPRTMVVDEDKCTGCGLCLVACQSTENSGALTVVDRVAKIDPEFCHSCNSCRIVCPEGAITMVWEPEYVPSLAASK